jgi:uncharacterized membrane protein
MSKRNSKTVSSKIEVAVTRRSMYLFIAAALLALIGLADSIYLTIKHLTGGIVPCSLTNGCEQVLNSEYATIAGLPLAGAGAFAYFCAFSLATLAIFGYQVARTLLFYLVLLMLAFSIWLFIVQAFMLHAFCQFCLLSAATTLLLTITVMAERFFPRSQYRLQ